MKLNLKTRFYKPLFQFLPLWLIFASSLASPSNILRVGVVDTLPPFTSDTQNIFSGISVDLWTRIANNENLKYKYFLFNETPDDSIKALSNGSVDVLLGPISITSDRYKLIDFSYPYFLNKIALIEPKGTSNLKHMGSVVVDIIESPFFLILLLLFILYVNIYWFAERKHCNHEKKNYWAGVGHIFWDHVLQKEKTIPHTAVGRCVFLVWRVSAAIFLASLLATVTSKFTLAMYATTDRFSKRSDLQDQLVAAVKGTNVVEEAEKCGARVVQAQDLDQAVQWLNQKKVAAVAEDYILAKNYLQNHHDPNLQMSSLVISNDQFAFAVRKNSPLLRKINHVILSLDDNDSMQAVCKQYIGQDAYLCSF